MAYCWFCGHETAHGEKIYRTSLCEFCGKPLKICRNCEFYAPGKKYDCREHITEPVTDKDRENYCDYFSPRTGSWNGDAQEKKHQEVRKKLDSLFKI